MPTKHSKQTYRRIKDTSKSHSRIDATQVAARLGTDNRAMLKAGPTLAH
jgi:hypothetical protein